MITMEFASRAEAFPFGLHVLVVDDDPTWLKILEKMLIKCSYKVTTCGLAKVALKLLRERREKFDIVITDVNMPDMDGFKLLEQLGLEMDLPVIMMSVDGETSRVMKGVQHGACDYLLKPIRMKELRNIWQHVYRKKIHEVQEIEVHDTTKVIRMYKHCSEHISQVSSGVDFYSFKKRKGLENKENSEQDCSDSSSTKKARVVWSVDLHLKFVNAVNQIGFDKIGPKKILDLMNIPGLTRENVASHLQKYRLYLTRLQQEKLQSEFHLKAPSIYFPSTTQKFIPETMNTTKVHEIETMIPLHVQDQIFQNQSYISEEKSTRSMSTCTVESISVKSAKIFEPLETEFFTLHEDLRLCSLQDFGFDGMDAFQYNDSATNLTDVYSKWYGGLEFNYDNTYDQMEYPIIDDCRFV